MSEFSIADVDLADEVRQSRVVALLTNANNECVYV